MTTTYKLVAFSRNVEIDLNGDPSDGTTDIGKHSGYGLVKYEDGNPVAMKTVEVTASSVFGAMNFAIPMDCLHRTLFQMFRSFRLILRFQIMFSNIIKPLPPIRQRFVAY